MKSTIHPNLTYILTLFVFLSACKTDNKKLLCQKWKTVSLRNAKMDQEIESMRKYIDTVGNLDKEIHKATDVKELKQLLQKDLDKAIEDQKVALDNTFMEFRENGLMFMTSIQGVDSVMFTLEDNFIKVDDSKLKGYGESMTFEILALNQDSLKLKLIDYGDTSIATMVPVKR